MEASAKSRKATTWTGAAAPAPPIGTRGLRAPPADRAFEPDIVEIIGVRTTSDRVRRAVNVAMAAVALVVAAPLMLVIAILVKLTSPGPVLYTQPRIGHDRRYGTDSWSPEEASSGYGNGDGIERGEHATARSGDGAAQELAGSELPAHRSNGGRPENGDHAPTPVPDPRSRDRGGRVFTIYKFRTMYTGAGDGREVWASPEDDRVTPVGRVLRKLHLDELPQLFNVLNGDMNLVGPRPEQPEIFARLADKVPGYRVRQQVRPGITGWAQVNHHYDRTLEDVRKKVALDLEYLERRSALEDLKITLATIPAVLIEGDAEGW